MEQLPVAKREFHENLPIYFTPALSFSPLLRLMLCWTCRLRAVTVYCTNVSVQQFVTLVMWLVFNYVTPFWAVSNTGYDLVYFVLQ